MNSMANIFCTFDFSNESHQSIFKIDFENKSHHKKSESQQNLRFFQYDENSKTNVIDSKKPGKSKQLLSKVIRLSWKYYILCANLADSAPAVRSGVQQQLRASTSRAPRLCLCCSLCVCEPLKQNGLMCFKLQIVKFIALKKCLNRSSSSLIFEICFQLKVS